MIIRFHIYHTPWIETTPIRHLSDLTCTTGLIVRKVQTDAFHLIVENCLMQKANKKHSQIVFKCSESKAKEESLWHKYERKYLQHRKTHELYFMPMVSVILYVWCIHIHRIMTVILVLDVASQARPRSTGLDTWPQWGQTVITEFWID